MTRIRQLLAPVLVAVTFLAAVGGCGGQSPGQPAAEETPDDPSQEFVTETRRTATTTIYFLTDDGTAPIGVRRTISRKSPFARESMKALLAGTTREEKENGITTAIPDGTRLLAMTYKRQGRDETVNLAGLPPVPGNAMQNARIITQIARTLIGISGIERIWLRNEGRAWGLWTMDNKIHSGPWSYDELTGFDISYGCAGTETVVCDHFAALP
jgi:spore germination protein GerM